MISKLWLLYSITTIAILFVLYLEFRMMKNIKPEFRHKKLVAGSFGIFVPSKWLNNKGKKIRNIMIIIYLIMIILTVISLFEIVSNYS